jgi:hypothetical protein
MTTSTLTSSPALETSTATMSGAPRPSEGSVNPAAEALETRLSEVNKVETRTAIFFMISPLTRHRVLAEAGVGEEPQKPQRLSSWSGRLASVSHFAAKVKDDG